MHLKTLILAALPAAAQKESCAEFIMTRWDTDADGRVTVQEVSERRRDLFIAFDENEDGLLDAAEYTPFNEGQESGTSIIERSSGQANGGKRNGSDMSMIAMDADHNGTVTETEFLAGSATWVERKDRDGDGVITYADFDR